LATHPTQAQNRAFLTTGLALQLEVSTIAVNIPVPKVGEKWWNSSLDSWLEEVAANIT
jgi:hypothetical protein